MNQSKPYRNRRRSMRRQSKRSTKIYCHGPMGLGPNLAVKLLDVSEIGLRALLTKEFPVGTELEVHLESICHRRPIRRWAEVVWSIPTQDGEYNVGISLRRPLPYRDLYYM